jgi:hypothetical protein
MTKYKPEWVVQALKEGKHPFFIHIPIIRNFHKEDATEIMGLGSKVSRSRSGHKMLQPFIEKMRTTAVGKPLLINHDPNQVAGKITRVQDGADDEFIPISQLLTPHDNHIVDAPRAKVEHWIENKVPLGLSVGGIASKSKVVKENGQFGVDIADGEIVETSVTPVNALKESDGTVKIANSSCPDGICGEIAQQILNGPNLPELDESQGEFTQDVNMKSNKIKQSSGCILNQGALDNANALIEEGSIDFETPWNRGSYEWDGNSEEQSQYCLGVDPTANYTQYQYRIGVNNLIFKQAVISVMDDAPAGSDIYSAADNLLQLIYASTANDTSTTTCPDCGCECNDGVCPDCGATVVIEAVKDELNNVNHMEANTMADEEIKQAVKILLEDRNERIAKEKDAELRQTIATELKQSVVDEVKKELKEEFDTEKEEYKQAALDAAKEIIEETLGTAMKNKDHIQQSVEGLDLEVGKKLLGSEDDEKKVEQNFRDPSKYPAVINGKVVQGMTPAQMFPTE